MGETQDANSVKDHPVGQFPDLSPNNSGVAMATDPLSVTTASDDRKTTFPVFTPALSGARCEVAASLLKPLSHVSRVVSLYHTTK